MGAKRRHVLSVKESLRGEKDEAIIARAQNDAIRHHC